MFSKACQYAIRAVVYLSKYSDEDNKIGVALLSEKLNVPRHFLAKILQNLSRSNLISSTKGPQGGFYLTDVDLDRPIIQIIECFDGPDLFKTCVLGLKKCTNENPCPLHDSVATFREEFSIMLHRETIREFAKLKIIKHK